MDLGQRVVAAAVIAATLIGTSPVKADTIQIAGGPGLGETSSGLGSFTGSISYEYGFGSGTLTINLTNTSPADNGGFIARLLFNINGDASATLTSSALVGLGREISWTDAVGEKQLTMRPHKTFGTFEFGARILRPPGVNGILVGETGVFTFAVTGDDAWMLSAAHFMSESAIDDDDDDADDDGDPTGVLFGVRFRGFNDEGSDKVEAVIIPLPAPILMAGAGLVGVILGRRRMTRLIARL